MWGPNLWVAGALEPDFPLWLPGSQVSGSAAGLAQGVPGLEAAGVPGQIFYMALRENWSMVLQEAQLRRTKPVSSKSSWANLPHRL
jgi:hypothetical protein